ncbi:hypothetical protein GXY_05411 [Novacetimonas hansenii ATCC 23769]|nr:hypothetical protein GXY_05411 [Novacetimonas hansenii ATCC 23769]
MEAEIEHLRTALADPGLYARDPNAFTSTTRKLEDAQARLTAAEERWLELEMLRESLKSN